MQLVIFKDFLCEVVSYVSFFALGKTKCNKEVAELFGITSTVMTSADGQKCFNTNQPAVEPEKLKDEEKWWKWRERDEVLKLEDDTIENIHHPISR